MGGPLKPPKPTSAPSSSKKRWDPHGSASWRRALSRACGSASGNPAHPSITTMPNRPVNAASPSISASIHSSRSGSTRITHHLADTGGGRCAGRSPAQIARSAGGHAHPGRGGSLHQAPGRNRRFASTTSAAGSGSTASHIRMAPLMVDEDGAVVAEHHSLGRMVLVGVQLTLAQVADELARRLVATFLDDTDGRRPAFGATEELQRDP